MKVQAFSPMTDGLMQHCMALHASQLNINPEKCSSEEKDVALDISNNRDKNQYIRKR